MRLQNDNTCGASMDAALVNMIPTSLFSEFQHSEHELTRLRKQIYKLSVRPMKDGRVFLEAADGDKRVEFALSKHDVVHLVSLLMAGGES